MAFARNEEIFGEEETADFVYKVLAGSVRTVRLLSDGRRQVVGFHLPGEVFGLEFGGVHRFSAEALEDSQVVLIRRNQIDRAAVQEPHAARALWAIAADDLARLQDHTLNLTRKSATERVGSFLVEMAERHDDADEFALSMSRLDMADYLGLTIETVSRAMTQLEREGLIALPSSRHVILKVRAQLAQRPH
jgi:CRP-like cAMP-binding protein